MVPVRVDVAIIGLGPVGATLANLLGYKGLRVVVVERDHDIHPLPRACHLDDTSLRVLQSVGLVGRVLSTSVPSLGMELLDRRGRPFLTFVADHTSNLFGYPTSVLFWQPLFEEILRTGVARFPSVDVWLGWEAVGLAASGQRVGLEARAGDGRARKTVEASFVVGCDGARSFARSHIGAELVDLGFDQPWLVVDVELKGPAELPDRIVQYCDPARPSTFVPLPDPYRRWELMALPGEDLAELEQPDSVRRLLSPWLSPDRFDVVRSAVYRFHALVADTWRRGGVLLAGDSAHQMPPFLGQGMCSGIRDAANLAWKLARVIEGRSQSSLLDTYEEERSGHVRWLCERAIEIGRLIQVTEAESAAEELLEPRAVRGDSGAAPLAGGLATDTAASGELLPQPQVRGVPLDDLLGSGFGLVSSTPFSESAGFRHVVAEPLGPWLQERQADFAIVRPDKYVYATGRRGALKGLADELSARIGPSR